MKLGVEIVPGRLNAQARADVVGGRVVKVPDTHDCWGIVIDVPVPAAWLTPTARSTDPDTSHRAAAKAALKADSNRARLLIAHHHAGTRGLTGDDIEAATGIAYEAIGPRRPSLERAGLVTKAFDDTGTAITRNDKQVYRITPDGAAEAERLQGDTAA